MSETPIMDTLIARHTEESKKPHGAGHALVQVTELIALARQLERQLAQAQAKVSELEMDATRYRYLRQSDCRDGVPFIAMFDGRLSQWTGKFADEQVDTAIDA